MAVNMRLNNYRKASVDASSPERLLLLLVREAVRSAEAAALEQDGSERRRMLDKSRRIVAELSDSLNTDYGGPMAFNMLRLYMFINSRLCEAVSGDDAGLPDALRVLRHVRDTWEEAVELAAQANATP
jgi:flagellar secretion chaperone FliS